MLKGATEQVEETFVGEHHRCEQKWTNHVRKRSRHTKRCERIRHLTHTGHSGSIACRIFFSLHRSIKRDDAQARLSALRGKVVSEQGVRREQMGKFWETYGHMGGCSEQHLHARHRLASLNWQMDKTAVGRQKSLESKLHRTLRDGRSHEVQRLTQMFCSYTDKASFLPTQWLSLKACTCLLDFRARKIS